MAWPWTKREPTPNDLLTRMDALERRFRSLELEWFEVADKLTHRLARQAKRDRDAIAVTEKAQGAIPLESEIPPPVGSKKSLLWARAAQRGLGGQHVR